MIDERTLISGPTHLTRSDAARGATAAESSSAKFSQAATNACPPRPASHSASSVAIPPAAIRFRTSPMKATNPASSLTDSSAARFQKWRWPMIRSIAHCLNRVGRSKAASSSPAIRLCRLRVSSRKSCASVIAMLAPFQGNLAVSVPRSIGAKGPDFVYPDPPRHFSSRVVPVPRCRSRRRCRSGP